MSELFESEYIDELGIIHQTYVTFPEERENDEWAWARHEYPTRRKVEHIPTDLQKLNLVWNFKRIDKVPLSTEITCGIDCPK